MALTDPNDRFERPADPLSARRLNIVGTWIVLLCGAGIFVANVTWERPFVERVCEPRPGPIPELCTNVRALTDSQWRSSAVMVLLALWAIAGAVAWRTWRHGHLVRNGPPAAFNKRRGIGTLPFRRRIVSMTPGFLAAVSFSVRKGTSDRISVPVDLACGSTEAGGEFCQTSTFVVEQTVTTNLGMSAWPQAAAWVLLALTLCWWIYVVAAENLARRFGEQNLWRTALRMRREAVPLYPAEQQRGNSY